MIVIMKPGASAEAIAAVEKRLSAMGLEPHASHGKHQTVIGALGDERAVEQATLEALPEVDRIVRVMRPYKFVSIEGRDRPSVIEVGGIPVGGNALQVIAGPCSVETPEQMEASAAATVAAGCRMMRGGAFKPRTSPYSFQGKGVDGLTMLREAADRHGLPIVTELMDVRMLDAFLENGVDAIQIGTRNMQNFELLKEVGRSTHTPVVLKRGFSATISEWLMAAEYIAAGGNHNIIFCERGVRGFEDAYRNMLDVTAIPVLKRETHLPVIIDPSHAGGKAWMVPALARAAIAAGADGLLVEMHPRPTEAWSDADQALSPDELSALMGELRGIATVLGRTL